MHGAVQCEVAEKTGAWLPVDSVGLAPKARNLPSYRQLGVTVMGYGALRLTHLTRSTRGLTAKL